MATPPSSPVPEHGLGYWRRVLRPLLWWSLLVLAMFAYHQHQLAIERTRINFSVNLQGYDVGLIASVKLDGQPVSSGQKISLGNHIFTITHPKAEPFSTNFFCLYGGRDFGAVNLIRTVGTLNVTAKPAAQTITITGPEYSLTLTNSTGTSLTVPADTYLIQAQYPHWSQAQKPVVFDQQTAACVFAPQYGVLNLSCNHEGATYQLLQTDGQEVYAGDLPVTITDLPSDRYQMIVTYHNRQIKDPIYLKANQTNDVPVEFVLGTARLESVPTGASVETMDGSYLGQTSLDVKDLPARPVQFRLTKPGYVSVSVSLDIVADQTAYCRTNLIGVNYQPSMQTARQALAAADYQNALLAVQDALAAKPDDHDALAIQREVNSRLAAEREEAEQSLRPRRVFTSLCEHQPDASLFQEYTFKTSQPAKTVSTAIIAALQSGSDVFDLDHSQMTEKETYETVANETFSLGVMGGFQRTCLLVVGQTKANETEILVKVVEYQIQHTIQVNGLFNAQDQKRLIALSPARMQMNDILQGRVRNGVSIVLGKIKSVIGEQ